MPHAMPTGKRPPTARCEVCLGTRTQHVHLQGSASLDDADNGCWCPRCLLKEPEARCRTFVEPTRPAVGRTVTRTGAWHPETSVAAGERAALRVGTLRKTMYDAIRRAGEEGMTDDEMERLLVKSHQSVSAARNTLMNDGWVEDGGKRRRTQWGQEAICWVAKP